MRAAFVVLLALLGVAPAAQASPVIVSLQVDGLSVAGQPVTLDVAARDPDASLIAAQDATGVAESACRLTRGGDNAATGPFAPGSTVAFGLPFTPQGAGIHLVDVTVRSGGCEGADEAYTQVLTLTVTLPDLLLPLGKVAPVRASACADADAKVGAGNAKVIRAAVICLLNEERAKAGLKPLADDKRLRKAATRHTRDMLSRHYFDHEGPSGPSLVQRLTKAKYWPASVAENIGAGSGDAATPSGMVDLWMHSDGHRANILTRAFKTVGVAAVPGEPTGSAGATFTLDFGSRK